MVTSFSHSRSRHHGRHRCVSAAPTADPDAPDFSPYRIGPENLARRQDYNQNYRTGGSVNFNPSSSGYSVPSPFSFGAAVTFVVGKGGWKTGTLRVVGRATYNQDLSDVSEVPASVRLSNQQSPPRCVGLEHHLSTGSIPPLRDSSFWHRWLFASVLELDQEPPLVLKYSHVPPEYNLSDRKLDPAQGPPQKVGTVFLTRATVITNPPPPPPPPPKKKDAWKHTQNNQLLDRLAPRLSPSHISNMCGTRGPGAGRSRPMNPTSTAGRSYFFCWSHDYQVLATEGWGNAGGQSKYTLSTT